MGISIFSQIEISIFHSVHILEFQMLSTETRKQGKKWQCSQYFYLNPTYVLTNVCLKILGFAANGKATQYSSTEIQTVTKLADFQWQLSRNMKSTYTCGGHNQ